MQNTMTLVRIPDRMSGPRHGGPRKERHFKFYINGHLFAEYSDDRPLPFNYASGQYLDKTLQAHIEKFERVLGCECQWVDHSGTETPKPNYVTNGCDHDWRQTDNWLIDRCAKCGEERA